MDKKDTKAQQQFRTLTESQTKNFQNKRLFMAQKLLSDIRAAGLGTIPIDLEEYTIEEHLPLVQKYYDLAYPKKYRISVFGDVGTYKPIYKGPNVAAYEIPLFLTHSHFYGIRRIHGFFAKRNYCIDCESPYDTTKSHTGKCKAKCLNCCGIGFGYPCKPTMFTVECITCRKFFNNKDCYDKHYKDKVCHRYKRCILR